MEPYSNMLRELKTAKAMERFSSLYGHRSGELARQLTRYSQLVKMHEDVFHAEKPIYMISSPGRVEIVGNHTDHQNGRVLATAINLDILAAVTAREDQIVRIQSEGYSMIELRLDDLSVHQEETGTSKALVRGIAARMNDLSLPIGGFEAVVTSDVLPGGGLSSSAAYEVLICAIFDALYHHFSIDSATRAEIAQYAENVYFGKPCGLMDQMTVSTGGMVSIDFKEKPIVSPLSFSFQDAGYDMIIVDTHGSHNDLTEDYAAICDEMDAVAALFGEKTLRRVRPEQLIQELPMVRQKAGDRAAMRALHFFHENARVKKQLNNIKRNDLGAFFTLIIESGHSSFMYLQNVYTPGTSQPLSIALALAAEMLNEKGAWRVHGGGFAGTTLNFVPTDMTAEFVRQMDEVFGLGSCLLLDVRPEGAALVMTNSGQSI